MRVENGLERKRESIVVARQFRTETCVELEREKSVSARSDCACDGDDGSFDSSEDLEG